MTCFMRRRFTPSVDHLALLALIAFAGLLFVGAALLPWWKTIGALEPRYALAGRLTALVLAAITLVGLVLPSRRAALCVTAAWGGISAPLLMLLYVSTVDAPAISAAVNQTSQAERLIANLTVTDVNPHVVWTEERRMWVPPTISNNFNLMDALEAASSFAKAGWWLALVAGFVLLVAAWAWDAPGVRRHAHRARPIVLLLASLAAAGFFGPPAVAAAFLSRARLAEAYGKHRAALGFYQWAARWDRRLNYSISFHQELGRLYGRAGLTTLPDYWALAADMLSQAGKPESAYKVYRNNVPDPTVDPALRTRYAHLLLYVGAQDFNAGRIGSALARWREAAAVEPENLETAYAVALGLTKAGSYAEAVPWWESIITKNEGVGLFKSNFVASLLYRKMITARAYAGLSWCHYRLGHLELALLYNAASKHQARPPIPTGGR